MAAAAAGVSEGRAGVKASKGLLLIFTLFSVVYFAHSLEARQHLEVLSKYHEGGLIEAAKKKAQLNNDLSSFVENFQVMIDKIAPLVKQLEAITESSRYLEDLPTLINDFLDEKIQEAKGVVKAYRKELEDIWNSLKLKEKKDSEL